MRIEAATASLMTAPATARPQADTVDPAATVTAASARQHPVANPAATIDPQLGIIVMQYYDPASGTTTTTPTAQQLRAYTLNGLPQTGGTAGSAALDA